MGEYDWKERGGHQQSGSDELGWLLDLAEVSPPANWNKSAIGRAGQRLAKLRSRLAMAALFTVQNGAGVFGVETIQVARRYGETPDSWAVLVGSGPMLIATEALCKDGSRMYEPQPSDRDEAFLAKARYTLDEAFEAAEARKAEGEQRRAKKMPVELDPETLPPQIDRDHPAMVRWRDIMKGPREYSCEEIERAGLELRRAADRGAEEGIGFIG